MTLASNLLSPIKSRDTLLRCALHSSPVPVEALLEYFKELPEDHRAALLTLREEDFAAELDAHLKYQLRICRDCRSNVTRAYRYLLYPWIKTPMRVAKQRLGRARQVLLSNNFMLSFCCIARREAGAS